MEYQYERLEKEYCQGDKVHNFNGAEYRVLEKLSDRNLLLFNLNSGQFTVGIGVGTFEKHTKGEMPTQSNSEVAIEWEHGVYLGYTPSQIDFEKVRYEYGMAREYENKKEGELAEYNIEVSECLSRVISVTAEDLNDAMEQVRDKYYGEEVILDAETTTICGRKDC